MSRKIVLGSVCAGALFVLGLSAFLLSSSDLPSDQIGGEDGKLGGDFTLRSYRGDVSLSDYEGDVVMLYFGFTSCTEVCSLSMNVIRRSLEKLAPAELEKVRVLLVSFDPARDTLKELDEYSKQFHSRIVGVTGTEQEIDAVINDYGAFYQLAGVELNDFEKLNNDYAFRHSSRYYIIDQRGELVDAMRHSSTANEIVARIRTLI